MGRNQFRANAPSSEEAVSTLLGALGKPLPGEYLTFLQLTNGGEGFIGEAYAMLWRCEDLIEYNQSYEVAELAPGFFLIGSNGGGEAYAFNLSSGSPVLYELPFVGMESQHAKKVTDSFDLFLAGLSNTKS
jgi:hypothetical protein